MRDLFCFVFQLVSWYDSVVVAWCISMVTVSGFTKVSGDRCWSLRALWSNQNEHCLEVVGISWTPDCFSYFLIFSNTNHAWILVWSATRNLRRHPARLLEQRMIDHPREQKAHEIWKYSRQWIYYPSWQVSLSLIHLCSPVHHPRATLRSLTAGPEGAGKYGLLEDSDALFTREPSHRESHMVLWWCIDWSEHTLLVLRSLYLRETSGRTSPRNLHQRIAFYSRLLILEGVLQALPRGSRLLIRKRTKKGRGSESRPSRKTRHSGVPD